MEFQVSNGRIFSVNEKQELIAEATFPSVGEGEVDVDYTYVNPAYRGQGIAGILMEALAKHLRENGLKAVASCSYAYTWLKKNQPVYGDIISDKIG